MLSLGVILTLRQIGARLHQLRLGLGPVCRSTHARRRQIHLGGGLLGQRRIEIGLGLVAGDDVIARIDLQQHVARVDEDIVVDTVLDDITGDLRSDRDGISFGVGVVGTLLVPRHQPIDEATDEDDYCDDNEDDDRQFAFRFLLAVVLFFILVTVFFLVVLVLPLVAILSVLLL